MNLNLSPGVSERIPYYSKGKSIFFFFAPLNQKSWALCQALFPDYLDGVSPSSVIESDSGNDGSPRGRIDKNKWQCMHRRRSRDLGSRDSTGLLLGPLYLASVGANNRTLDVIETSLARLHVEEYDSSDSESLFSQCRVSGLFFRSLFSAAREALQPCRCKVHTVWMWTHWWGEPDTGADAEEPQHSLSFEFLKWVDPTENGTSVWPRCESLGVNMSGWSAGWHEEGQSVLQRVSVKPWQSEDVCIGPSRVGCTD